MTLSEWVGDWGLVEWVIVLFIIYMVIIKANLGASAQPKDYEQMKQQDAQRTQQRQQSNNASTQTVEQTTTTTTTTTTALGQWENPSQAINKQDTRVNYNDPVGSDSTNATSLDSFDNELNREAQQQELEQARNEVQ